MLLLLQLDPVQTFLAKKVLNVLSEKTEHEITLEKVNVSWLDRANLKEFLILDKKSDTLIYAQDILVNYRIWDLLNGEYLNVEEIISDGPKLQLIKHDSISKLNLSEFINTLKSDSIKKGGKPIQVGFIGLKRLDFSLLDKTKTLKSGQVDFANLDLKIPNFEMTDLQVRADTIAGSVLQMQGVEQNSGFVIQDFNSVFSLCAQSLSISDLDLVTPSSHISDSLQFTYSGLDDFSNFIDSVSFVFHFDKSQISSNDFRLITGSNSLKSNLKLDGKVWGSVGDFNIEDATVRFGDESYIEGAISCYGLPDLQKLFILAELTDAHLVPRDIEDYVGKLSTNITRLGRVDFNGSFAGFLRDFVAKGEFETDLGSVKSDINLKIPDVASDMSYKGNVVLTNVNIGALIQNDLIQTVNLKASINGNGITKDNANFNLKAVAYESGLKGYFYDSIRATGQFSSNFFEGSFSVQDPNCQLRGNAQIDFTKEIEVLNLKMAVDSADLGKLMLSKNPLFISGLVDIEAVDLDVDHFTGYANIDSTLIIFNNDKEVFIDSLRFNAAFEDSTRLFAFSVPGIKSELKGDFKISDVIQDLPIVINSYAEKLNLGSDSLSTQVSDAKYKLTFKAELDNLSKYLDSLEIPLQIPEKAFLEISFRKSKNFIISSFFNTKYLRIKNAEIFNPTLEINGANDENSRNFLTNFILSSDRQLISGVPETKDFLLEGVWSEDVIEVATLIKQEATSSDLRIMSNIQLLTDSVVVKMLPSDIIVFDEEWKFNPQNLITFLPDRAMISDFEIFNQGELLSVDGVYSSLYPTSITIGAEDLNMNKASLFSKTKIDGFLNGAFSLFQDKASDSFKFDGGFQIIQLQLEDFPIGNVVGSADWNPNQKLVSTKLDVVRDDFKSIQVKGRYFPLKANDQLDFDVTFDQADLIMGQPFLAQNFSDIRGSANGVLKITGNLNAPQVNGNCSVENGAVTINYLNTDYSFEGKVNFNSNAISFSNFDLTDRKGSQAQVSGSLTHDSFKNLGAKIQVIANNFEFLNTTSLDNNLYYGSVYGTGEIDISGPFSDLLIKASVRTEKNTRFFVPLAENSSVTQEDYISFIDLSDTSKVVEEIRYRGLKLDFDIEVTPDAYCELIFDLKAGDIVRGRGRGNLKLTLDTDGEFHMFGPIEITDGAYNFTMANIISKEFNVVPGSRISWYGNPYSATLDLKATYLQRASFSDLNPSTDDQSSKSPTVPLLVVLNLNGGMLSPQIDFEIQLQDEGGGIGDEKRQLDLINNNDEELRNQVVSLLFLKRFSPKSNLFNQSAQGFNVRGSASEVLSGQLSYLLSQVDENLEIDVDLTSLDNEAFNTLQLRLAYTFLDGRLKVTRGGAVTSNSQEDVETSVLNDIVGDLSVEYSLTKDGKLRAKVFRTTSQSLIATDDRIQETGVSLRFVHSFSDFKELLMMKHAETVLKKEQEEEKQESLDSLDYQN